MPMISISSKGEWDNTRRYLQKMKDSDIFATLDKYGEIGRAALVAATPVESGLTAQSWSYEVVKRRGYYSIRWLNSNVEDGRPIAILLQYGHGTKNGGYVQGRDYIMPAIRGVFDQIDAEVGKVVRG
jgi:hypothetical protein